MFCSTCGVAVVKGLSYCNYCGAKLNQNDTGKPEVRPESLIFGMLATFVFGMIALTMLMGVMKVVLELPIQYVLGFALVPFLVMLIMEGVFIRLLLQRTQGGKLKRDAALATENVTNELDAAHARALPDSRPSVTEHTTRAFDPIYTERK